jgi:hypothetical protein
MRLDNDTENQELSDAFLAFCTFVSLTSGKKTNLANIFLRLLQNKHLRCIFKKQMEIDSDYDVVSIFLQFDPSLHKSKYIKKYLNKAGPNKIKN